MGDGKLKLNRVGMGDGKLKLNHVGMSGMA